MDIGQIFGTIVIGLILVWVGGWVLISIYGVLEEVVQTARGYESSSGRPGEGRWVKKPPKPEHRYSVSAGRLVKNKKWRPPDNEED